MRGIVSKWLSGLVSASVIVVRFRTKPSGSAASRGTWRRRILPSSAGGHSLFSAGGHGQPPAPLKGERRDVLSTGQPTLSTGMSTTLSTYAIAHATAFSAR